MSGRLLDRRRDVERAWHARFDGVGPTSAVRQQISTSWDRSARSAAVDLAAAPVDESEDPVRLWRESRLRPAIEAVEDELQELAKDRGFVAAVMDDRGRILWTAGGRHMRRRAERVNFAPGGRWDEDSVGTNALALALDADQPAEVFSAEHYAAMVHGWCCFAAPLHDPASRRPLGVLDLSSTWDRAHPMALATVRALALAAQAVLDAQQPGGPASTARTRVRVLGASEVTRGGVVVPLALRHAEIITLLALNPDGLTPEQLRDQVYGDEPVVTTTVKAEVSHVRALLGGGVSQRRYRLDPAIRIDAADVVSGLRSGDADRVSASYLGPLLPTSESPAIREWREVLVAGVRDVAIRSGDATLAERLPYDETVQQAAAAALDPNDKRGAWAQARLRRAAKN